MTAFNKLKIISKVAHDIWKRLKLFTGFINYYLMEETAAWMFQPSNLKLWVGSSQKSCKGNTILVCPFVLFLLAIDLSVLLRYSDFDYPFGIFKRFLSLVSLWKKIMTDYSCICRDCLKNGFILTSFKTTVINRRTDNTMSKKNRAKKRQTMIYKNTSHDLLTGSE